MLEERAREAAGMFTVAPVEVADPLIEAMKTRTWPPSDRSTPLPTIPCGTSARRPSVPLRP